jgi:hypothetical protein
VVVLDVEHFDVVGVDVGLVEVDVVVDEVVDVEVELEVEVVLVVGLDDETLEVEV